MPEDVFYQPGAPGIESDHGFVNNQDIGAVEKGGRHDKTLFHAVGIAFHQFILPGGQLEQLKKLSRALVLGMMEATVLIAIGVAISTRLPLLANFNICTSIYVIGNLTPLLVKSSVVQGQFEPDPAVTGGFLF